jgi:hypothetical protein
MTRKDFIIIAQCIAECHNKKYDLDDIISFYSYKLHLGSDNFNPTLFREFIYEQTKPEHIPEEQAKEWAKKKSKHQ